MIMIHNKMKKHTKTFPKLFAIIMAMVFVCFNFIATSDVHAAELLNNDIHYGENAQNNKSIGNNQTTIDDHKGDTTQSDNNQNDTHCMLCVNLGCHHMPAYICNISLSDAPYIPASEILNNLYSAPPNFEITTRLLKPPRT